MAWVSLSEDDRKLSNVNWRSGDADGVTGRNDMTTSSVTSYTRAAYDEARSGVATWLANAKGDA